MPIKGARALAFSTVESTIVHDRPCGLQIGAALSRDGDRILRRSQRGLIGIESRAQAAAFGADIAEFGKPVSSQLALNREVPLLGGAHNPMQRHGEFDQAVHIAAESIGAACLGRSERQLGSKPLQDRSRGHISLGGSGAQRRNSIGKRGAVRKQIGQAVRSGKEANQERIGRRNDGEIVYRAQVLAHAVNAVTAANRRGVMTA